jgi:hypothetical protein
VPELTSVMVRSTLLVVWILAGSKPSSVKWIVTLFGTLTSRPRRVLGQAAGEAAGEAIAVPSGRGVPSAQGPRPGS